jgi:acetyl-CoA carboxylase beta subunit
MSFSGLTPEQRIAALLDDAGVSIERAGAMLTASGTVDGRSVHLAATDPAIARGAIGVAEADALARLLRFARDGHTPVLLSLDSAGAKVDEGLPALGAFRRLFREALLDRIARVPLLALLGPSCFGGASMLACVCDRRIYLPHTRLAASGPTVIEGASGKSAFDAKDRDAVFALMGATARKALHDEDAIVDDTPAAQRDAVVRALASVAHAEDAVQPQLAAAHARLRERLAGAGMLAAEPTRSEAVHARLAHLLPAGYAPLVARSAFLAQPAARSGKAVFLGTVGAPVDAFACWQLAEWLQDLRDAYAGSPLVLVLDAEAHAATVADERVLLSDYIVHLSLAIACAAQAGHRTVLWLPGAASGASYVAFASPVDRVSALPSARIAILPAGAIRRILGDARGAEVPAADWIEAGVADALLDARLQGYAGGKD